jgi:TolA-binding protein
MYQHLLKLGLFLGLFFFSLLSMGQKTASMLHEDRDFREGLELFEKEKYGAAQPYFKKVVDRIEGSHVALRVDAEYFYALCALKLYHKDTEHLMSNFIKQRPESKWVLRAYYELAIYHFQRKKYKDALEYFEKVKEIDLEENEIVEYRFKKGYSLYKEQRFDEASSLFYLVKDTESDYNIPAKYYYAHIAYERGNYQMALESFEKLSTDPTFGKVVPYYIAQIYFMQKRYDELLAYAPAILDTAKAQKAEDISKIIGVAYYNKERYAEAIPYLEKHYLNSGRRTRDDAYQLGYSLYRNGEYVKALARFSEVKQEDDLLTQLTTYHMAHSYLKLNEKAYARNAFQATSNYTHDRTITEDALFNYAKLAYELSFDPFHEAIRALGEYLDKYPDSPRKEEAYEFLLNIYISTKNYDAALTALDKIKNKNLNVQTAYQMVAFNQGVQLFQSRKFEEAITYFKKVQDYPRDLKLNALRLYWMAEANYQLRNYDQAAENYNRFLTQPGAYTSGVYQKAYYGLGYCQFQQKKFAEAAISLRKYAEGEATEPNRANDAYIRIGDCYLVTKNYDLAVKYYDKALAIGKVDNDYALFQLGLTYSLMNNTGQQIAALKKLGDDYPNSPMVVAAKFQMGNTYLNDGKYDQALVLFNEIISGYSGNTYVRRALLQKGLIQYRKEQYQEALVTFKSVVEQFPTLDDSKEAIARIEDIYVQLGRIDDYNAWVSNVQFYNVSTARLDSITYAAAEKKYVNNDCNGAIPDFANYLSKYSGGLFALNANFYMAECLFTQKKYEDALVGYNFVISQPQNKFTEAALLVAATINYNNKQYQTALSHYSQLEKIAEFKINILEAQIGQLRSNYKMGNFSQALVYADMVILNDGTPNNILTEARLLKGKILYDNKNFADAKIVLTNLQKQNSGPEGAEAKYILCKMDYESGNYKVAETEIFNLIKEYPAYDTWKMKGLLLLSDVYVALKDSFQAKAVLQNILANVSDPAIRTEAQLKLDAIIATEAGSNQQAQPKSMEVEIGSGSDSKILNQLEEESEEWIPAPKNDQQNENDEE